MNKFILTVLITGACFGASLLSAFIVVKNMPQQSRAYGGLGALLTDPLTSASSTVTSTNTLILATSTAREYAAIVNDGTSAVYLSIGTAAVAGKGILLNANGGSYEINDQNLITGAINGITSSGSSNVTVLSRQ